MEINEIEIECESCRGTGLYVGMAELNGCAVVCSNCNGTGKDIFKYKKFTGRKLKNGIKRIFASSFGYGHSAHDYTDENGRTIRFSKGGVSYTDWLKGKKPLPVKDLYCPYIWDNRGIGNEPLEKCRKYLTGLGCSISECKIYTEKASCWEEYEEQNKKTI